MASITLISRVCGPDGAQNVVGIDQAAGLRRNERRLHAVLGHALRGLQHRRVLDRRGDEVIAGMQQAEDGGVVALGAAGVEHHLGVMAIEELGQGLARAVHGRARLLPVQVDRGGVAEVLHPIGTHGLHHLRAAEVWWHWHPYRLGAWRAFSLY